MQAEYLCKKAKGIINAIKIEIYLPDYNATVHIYGSPFTNPPTGTRPIYCR